MRAEQSHLSLLIWGVQPVLRPDGWLSMGGILSMQDALCTERQLPSESMNRTGIKSRGLGKHMGCLLQDMCGNQVEAQQSHLDALDLGVAASIKEDGEASQMDELQASLQVCLPSALTNPLRMPVVMKRARKSCCII